MGLNNGYSTRQERYQLLQLALRRVRHDTRLLVLDALADGKASPVEIANRCNVPLGSLAYHIRAMAADGLIVLVDTRRVRGAIEHIYKLSPRGRRLWKNLGLKEKSL